MEGSAGTIFSDEYHTAHALILTLDHSCETIMKIQAKSHRDDSLHLESYPNEMTMIAKRLLRNVGCQ